jgi:hypothetical protein
MLLGNRQEFRFGEIIAKKMMTPFRFLFPGKYKPIHAKHVAKSMVEFSKKELTGFSIYHYQEMMEVLRSK